MKNYFELEAGVYTRWFLGAPLDPHGREIDPRLFTRGIRVEGLPPLSLPIAQPGDVVDFNLAAFDMPVTTRAFNDAVEEVVGDAVQRIPVTVEGDSDTWEILNVCNLVTCIDEVRTKHIMKWTDEDGRPDKIGDYRMVVGMRIFPSVVQRFDIFRVSGWEISLVVSDRLKKIAEEMDITGVHFDLIT